MNTNEKLNPIQQEEENILNNATGFVKSLFPILGKKNKAVLVGEPTVVRKESDNYEAEMNAKEKGNTYGHRLKFDINILDNEDNIIGKKTNYMTVPSMTDRRTFIVGGNEYQVTNQMRLDPASYSFKDESGQVRSQFNTSIGVNFKIILQPGKNIFKMQIGGSSYDLYPLITLLGGTDSEMQSAWGKELWEINKNGHKSSDLGALYNKLFRNFPPNEAKMREDIINYFNRPSMKKETNNLTLGLSEDHVTPAILIRAAQKIINIADGKEKEDERDNLIFQTFQSPADLMKHRLDYFVPKMQKNLSYKIDHTADPERIFSGSTFSEPIQTFFTSTELSNPTEQTNLLHMLAAQRKITRMGEGGIPDVNQITTKARSIHPSQYGFVDPYQTPESTMVGIVTSLVNNASKRPDGRLENSAVDPKTGKEVRLTPLNMWNSTVMPSDSFKNLAKNKKAQALRNGKVVEATAEEVDYVMPTSSFYSPLVSLIPFQNSNQGNRTEMASRQMSQHTFLKNREHPLVSVYNPELGMAVEEAIGKSYGGAIEAEGSGTVENITNNEITVKYDDGSKKTYKIYHNFHLNQKSYLNHEVKVKKGDKIRKGQILADSNNTKDGRLAFGVNLRTAYMPWKGLNFEDGTIVSESASKKLTSMHMHTVEIQPGPNDFVSKNKFKALFPTLYTAEQLNKIGDNGIVKEGETLNYGDPIILYAKKRTIKPEDIVLGSISKKFDSPYSEASETWHYNFPGTVVRITDAKQKRVRITTEEPLQVGDKISGRHGNKGIITQILPDGEMPRDKEGESVDIILNPQGVIGRINPSQLLENALAKVGKKQGKNLSISNFDHRNNNWAYVLKKMKEAGIKETDELMDPSTGESLGEINTGYQYILKLDQPVRKKIAGRGVGPNYTSDFQPAKGEEGGQSIGSMEIYSLLAHGAKNILRETGSIKADKNDDFWYKFQSGQPYSLPTKPSFITNKLLDHIKVLGVDLEKRGQHLHPIPFTSKEVLASSSGAVGNSRMLKSKGDGIEPEKEGLFDPKVFGGQGIDGKHWGHIHLEKPIVNPLFEDSVKSLMGLTQGKFDSIVSGDMYLSKAGGFKELTEKTDKSDIEAVGLEGLDKALSQIKPTEAISELTKELKATKNISKRDAINKRIKYLKGLENMKAENASIYMMKDVAVLPPLLRPAVATPDGNLIVSDMNYAYKDVIDTNRALKEDLELGLGGEKELQKQLYKSVKALQGFGDPISFGKTFKGVTDIITGTQNKSGFFQGRVVKKKQEMSGRSTITPNPMLGIDEMAIPADVAWKMFEPKIKREMSRFYDSATIRKHLDERNQIAERFLQNVMKDNLILANRAPTLHKGSILAFRPKLSPGDAIEIPNLVTGPFNADFDGDSVDSDIILHNRENSTLEKIHISNFPHLPEKVKENDKVTEYKVDPKYEIFSFNHDTKIWEWKSIEKFSIHRNLENYEVFYKTGKMLKSSNDSSLFVVPRGKLIPERTKPQNAIGCLSPNPNKMSLAIEKTRKIDLLKYNDTTKRRGCRLSSLELERDNGWFVGMIVGDGWHNLETKNERVHQQLMLANSHKDVVQEYERIVKKLLPEATITLVENEHEFDGFESYSEKRTFSCEDLAWFFYKETGKLAHGKKLPSFTLNSPEDFRWGLFSGLIDSDGYFGWSNSKGKKPQFNAKYDTKSKELCDDIIMLAFSLGITTSITHSRNGYIICFRTNDIKKNADNIILFQESKKEALEKLKETELRFDQTDYLPVTEEIANLFAKKYYEKNKETKEKQFWSKYISWKKIATTFKVCRYTAELSLSELNFTEEENETIKEFKSIVESGITYDTVERIERQPDLKTMWDLTIPGSYTFLTADGIAVFDTMALHVPVSTEAQTEAKKMTPSQVLLNPRNSGLFFSPSQEMVLGVYQGTKPGGKDTGLSFANVESALLKKKEIGNYNNLITINGIKAPLGTHWINNKLPEKFKNYKLTFDKKTVQNLIGKIVEEEPDKFAEVIDHLKNVGNAMSSTDGNTITVKDFSFFLPKKRELMTEFETKYEKISNSKASEEEKEKQKILLMADYSEKIEEEQKRFFKEHPENNVGNMFLSGSRGTIGQIRQSLGAPLLMRDYKMDPSSAPIKNSYIEGQTVLENLSAAPSARLGAVMKVSSVTEPGALSKELVAAKMSGIITEEDCGQTKQALRPIKNVLGRFLAADFNGQKRNDLIDKRMIENWEKIGVSKVPIRVQFDCLAKRGLCSKCYGADEYMNPVPKGTNVGVIDAQSLSEPLTQGAMKVFHTGGLVSKAEADHAVKGSDKNKARRETGFGRISQLLHVPLSIPEHASLAEFDGIVQEAKRDPSGGSLIKFTNGQEILSPSPELLVKNGQAIKKGDQLTDGTIRPQDLARLRGVQEAREYMEQEAKSAYEDMGAGGNPRMYESIVAEQTSYAKVTESDHPNILEGDVLKITQLDEENKKGAKIKYEPLVVAIDRIPLLDTPDSNLLQDMNFRELGRKIKKNFGFGNKIHFENTVSPIASYVMGNFGRDSQGNPTDLY